MFFLSWSPYAFVCIYRAFWDSHELNPFISTLPAMFAKSSLFITPLLYIASNEKVKKELKKSLFRRNSTLRRKTKKHIFLSPSLKYCNARNFETTLFTGVE